VSDDRINTGRPVEDVEAEFVERFRDAAYGCYSSGHKFCREVCPVYQVTRNEGHTPTAFHAQVLAMEKGLVEAADVVDDFTHCTQCGACELRCPNTLFAGDFYRHRTRTVSLVKAARAMCVEAGLDDPAYRRWNQLTDERGAEPVLGAEPAQFEDAKRWAEDLKLPVGGETVLFCDCEAAFYRTSLPRSVAAILRVAGVEFGLMGDQRCCGGPAAEMGYTDIARRLADHNTEDWRRHGVRRVLVLDPHDYITFTEDYPAFYGDAYLEEFEVVLVIDLVAELIREGRLRVERPIERVATYHDSCRLNKRKGIHEAPREILRAIPGLTFRDHDPVTQWAWCSGAGGGMAIAHPEITAQISDKRLERAATLDVDLLVSACVWSERPLAASGLRKGVQVRDLMELVAESAGLDGYEAAP
jgi:heterodisulfide reductase subunit D